MSDQEEPNTIEAALPGASEQEEQINIEGPYVPPTMYPSDVASEMFPMYEDVKDESEISIIGTDGKKISE